MVEESGTDCDGWDNSECSGTPYCPPRCPRYLDSEGVPYVVSPLERNEQEALVEMYETLDADSRSMNLPPISRSAIETWLQRLVDTGWNLVVRHGETIVGHIGIAPADATDPQFVLFIHHDYQNRGLGTELLKHAVAYAADHEYEELKLMVSSDNLRAIHVYKNLGFEVEDDQCSLIGYDIEMRLSLAAAIADRVRLPPADR